MTDEINKPTAPVEETPIEPTPDVETAATEVPVELSSTPDAAPAAAPRRDARPMGGRGGRGGMNRGGGRGGPGGRRPGGKPGDMGIESDYEEKNLEISRVTRVTKGGKRMRFRALTVIGNRKGRVGFGLAKGLDVALATGKSTAQARKGLITIPFVKDTIPFPVEAKFGAAKILLKPAPKGTGIKAGGAMRVVLELAGVPNVVGKILGSANKVNNVKATFAALKKLRAPSSDKTEK